MNPVMPTNARETNEALLSTEDNNKEDRRAPFAAAKTGLWLFLATASVTFSMLLSTYFVRKGWPDWQAMPRPGILWLNTLWLILSSSLLEWAKRQSELRPIRFGLLCAGAFAFFFLIGQLVAWQEMSRAGYYFAAHPASSFFFLITALHGVHLLGGLVAWGWTAAKIGRQNESHIRVRLELCAIYWHFLLVVWLAILGLIWFTQ
jgi:cytochrome c oxidase subunit 3